MGNRFNPSSAPGAEYYAARRKEAAKIITASFGKGTRILTLVLVGIPGIAVAHDHGAMKYDAFCCQGDRQTGDCQAIPAGNVTVTKDGFAVTLKAGEHRLVTRPHRWMVPFGSERQSTNGDYHACIFPDEDTLRCFYSPPMGN